MEKTELALESAEIAGSGVRIKERRLSPFLKRSTFALTGAFGEGGKEALCHTLIATEDPLVNDELLQEMCIGVEKSVRELSLRRKKRVLAVGLGNPSAVVDALGAETVKRLSAGEKAKGYLAVIIPSVFGVTGLESAAIVRGVAQEYRPDLVLTVDTLSTRRAERLCRAVQVNNGGVIPGGGVGNGREAITEGALGVPVISVGVPLLARADRVSSLPAALVVTPKEIDLIVPRFARIIAAGVEKALF